MSADVPDHRQPAASDTSAHPRADGADLILAALNYLRGSLSPDRNASGSPSLSRQKEGLREWAGSLGLLLDAELRLPRITTLPKSPTPNVSWRCMGLVVRWVCLANGGCSSSRRCCAKPPDSGGGRTIEIRHTLMDGRAVATPILRPRPKTPHSTLLPGSGCQARLCHPLAQTALL